MIMKKAVREKGKTECSALGEAFSWGRVGVCGDVSAWMGV